MAILLAGGSFAEPVCGGGPEDLVREFDQRREVLSDDSTAVITLGLWASEAGLIEQADRLYRRHLQSNPDDVDVYDKLCALWKDQPLPTVSRPLQNARSLLPASFASFETPRFVILSDADPDWTRRQIRNLDNAHHQFTRFVERLNLRPLPLQHKLVCVLFSDRDAYRQFATDHDSLHEPSVAGYYSPINDRIVFYDPATSPSISQAHEKLDSMSEELSSLSQRIEDAGRLGDAAERDSLRRVRSRYESHYRTQVDRVSAFIDETATATTIHEAIHQLMFHTHTQSPFVQYPLWISEGLATAFETDEPMHAFGPDQEFAPRRESFDALLSDHSLRPLAELVSISALDLSDQSAPVVYQQSYALVTWMYRFRRTELASYLDLMQREAHGRPTAERHLALFERAFGPAKLLERTWLRYEYSRAGLEVPNERSGSGRIILTPSQ